MKSFVAMVVLFLLPTIGFTGEVSKRDSVEELMILMNMDSLLDTIYSQLEKSAPDMAKQFGIESSEQKTFNNFMSRYVSLMREEMSWKKMKEPMIDIYQKNFTEKEIQDMLTFYKSETGKSVIEKMPAVMQDSVVLSQAMLKDFYPKLQTLIENLKAEIKAEKERPEQRNSEQKGTL